MESIYTPIILDKSTGTGKAEFIKIMEEFPKAFVSDHFKHQKKELLKTYHPHKQLTDSQLEALYQEWQKDLNVDKEGVWVWYPWLQKMVHLLPKDEFIALRTSRNQHKITPAEQKQLIEKRVGIIGLSVGHAVALTLATERGVGHLKLADFDTIDLSNLNRIKTGVFNIGINKSVVTAREIAEIDPFIVIECYTEGLTNENIQDFLTGGGKLDLLIDECDGLDIKIKVRLAARTLCIPVIMETSDRGMMDVERFDLEPKRPILHGLAEELNPDKLGQLTMEQKIPIVLKLTDAFKGSLRGRASLLEIGQTIGTWPQLASAVALGGAVVTDACRRIFLGQFTESGRFYVDMESIVCNQHKEVAEDIKQAIAPIYMKEAMAMVENHRAKHTNGVTPSKAAIEEMVTAACQAPSTGNDQPWKWVYQDGLLYLLHDVARSDSFGDYKFIASDITFGGAAENLILKAYKLGYKVYLETFPEGEKSRLIAIFSFFGENDNDPAIEKVNQPDLVNQIFHRSTNRNPTKNERLSQEIKEELNACVVAFEGAKHFFFDDEDSKRGLGSIIGGCDRIRLLNKDGHKDFVTREMRWTPKHAEETRDGIDIRTLCLAPAEIAALMLMKDPGVASLLHKIDGGKGLIDITIKSVMDSAGIGMITMSGGLGRKNFFDGGRVMENFWLKATELNLDIHPLISPFYLFPRISRGQGEGLDPLEKEKIERLKKNFQDITKIQDNCAKIFMYKIGKTTSIPTKALRLPLTETLFWGEHTNVINV